MIKERTYYIAVCDGCGTEIPAESVSRRTARNFAEANGWKTVIGDMNGTERHLCPKCKDRKKTWYYGG